MIERMLKMKSRRLLFLFLCLPLLFSCSNASDGRWVSFTVNDFIPTENHQYVIPFNTQMKLNYYKDTDSEGDDFESRLSSLYRQSVIDLHRVFDRHYSYLDENQNSITNVKSVNDAYGTGEEVSCSEELYSLLKWGYEMTLETNGYFNFFMGNLTSFWDEILDRVNDLDPVDELDPFYSETQREEMLRLRDSVPTIEEIESMLEFDDEKRTVVFHSIEDFVRQDGALLPRKEADDPYRPVITSGGIAKGYATDLLKEILIENGFTHGYLNSGSSSIASLSAPDYIDKGYQKISIVDPRSKAWQQEVAVSIVLDFDYALSTSGNYTNGRSYYFTDPVTSKKIYRHHIIDPFTGECSQEHASVTLVSEDLTNAQLDALSTAFVNLPLEDGLQFRKKWIESHSCDLNVIFIDIDDEDNLSITINEEFKDSVSVAKKEFTITYA